MDVLDLEIVHLLYANGGLSWERITREIKLSRPAVHEPVKRLEARGVIRGYGALVDWASLGLPLTAFIWARTTGAQCGEVGQEIMQLGNEEAVVEECHRVMGEYCLLIKARLASPLALQDLIDRVSEVEGVKGTMTTLALSTLDGEAPAEAGAREA